MHAAALDVVADAIALIVLGWIVVIGGIGAALGSLHGRPTLGFLLSVVVPVPGLGWLVVVAVTRGAPIGAEGGLADDFFVELSGEDRTGDVGR